MPAGGNSLLYIYSHSLLKREKSRWVGLRCRYAVDHRKLRRLHTFQRAEKINLNPRHLWLQSSQTALNEKKCLTPFKLLVGQRNFLNHLGGIVYHAHASMGGPQSGMAYANMLHNSGLLAPALAFPLPRRIPKPRQLCPTVSVGPSESFRCSSCMEQRGYIMNI